MTGAVYSSITQNRAGDAARNAHAPGAGAIDRSAPLDRLLADFGDLVVARDLDGRILHANDAFVHVTGCSQPLGRSLLDFYVSEDGDRSYDANFRTLVTVDGPRLYDWREVVGRDPATGAVVVHALGRDVTQRHDAERDLIAGRDRAESANAAKSRFLAMVSHEVRTPLNGILGITELLARTSLTHEQQSYVEAVRHSGHALLSLIEDLLDFSSMEAGRFYLRPEPGNLREMVGSVVELSALQADEKNIEVAAYVAPDVPENIVADHGRLRQVLFNLIGNSVKFTEVGGVLVEVSMDGGRLHFRVTDTGPGVGEADRQRIFREFEQIESGSTRRKGGAGLGLAISARLVAAMDGALTVESDGTDGSTFAFHTPLVTPEGEASSREGCGSLAGSRVLLVAPDGPTNTALLRQIRDQGGRAEHVEAAGQAAPAVHRLGGEAALTDVVVDNRIAGVAEAIFATLAAGTRKRIGRTMMVTPAEREALTKARAQAYSAWLIRPLRPSSVVKVLRRETGGLGGWLEERSPGEADPLTHRRANRGGGRKLSVLLAEDNPVNALLVRSALQRGGHEVVHVTNGRALVERACDRSGEESRFDLVLTDLSMPEMDGIEAIQMIRAYEKSHALKPVAVVVLTADGQARTRDRAMEIGAADYVEKPVDPDVLLQTVEQTAIQAA